MTLNVQMYDGDLELAHYVHSRQLELSGWAIWAHEDVRGERRISDACEVPSECSLQR